ncbi:MAG: hypothetical protein K5896_11720 [Prevotella sp.]|nr:hypothetical protein [Prevotella sp.]
MKKTIIISVIAAVLLALAVAASLWFFVIQPKNEDLKQQDEKMKSMQELAELEKEEMESEYAQLDLQYGEMMMQITNDSLIAQLTREQLRAQQLLEELKQVKADNAAEITRLKRELNSVRAVLRDYIRQVDSLNQVNQHLRNENSQLSGRLEESNRENQSLQQERQQLTERVTIAAQLNATAISMTRLGKKKAAKKMSDTKSLQVNFNIARNVTAENGERTIYVRVMTPTGSVLSGGGYFNYENRQLEYSMKKVIEYSGEETPVVVYWNVEETLMAGDYHVSIFADGNMIGDRTFSYEK